MPVETSALPIEVPAAKLEGFCRKWKVSSLALFGSVLRDDFRSSSDVDVLVTFAADARWSLWNVIAAEEELALIFGRPVDLVERRAVEESENWIRRRSILDSAVTIYG